MKHYKTSNYKVGWFQSWIFLVLSHHGISLFAHLCHHCNCMILILILICNLPWRF
ncbi:hypothetical protein HanRHA438_Chr03g0110241 [Helianthus annuus]|nr:hypothetical protein HanIR_Chr03g0108231 [Helianthus annuus]KAJ0934684.1 hypothetical protein HanRHA438_Chr03g0110241 [Helianthus annuus]